MAFAVAAGMFSSALLTLIVVLVIYLVLDDGVEEVRSLLRRCAPAKPVSQRTAST